MAKVCNNYKFSWLYVDKHVEREALLDCTFYLFNRYKNVTYPIRFVHFEDMGYFF
jgi:hypothetical protein